MGKILVRVKAGAWTEWNYEAIVRQSVDTCLATYADGRQETIECKPYEIDVTLHGSKVFQLFNTGAWTEEEVHAVGARIVDSFEPKKGFVAVGDPVYTEDKKGKVTQTYEVEKLPEPPAEKTKQERMSKMLEDYGLTIDDLKSEIAEAK